MTAVKYLTCPPSSAYSVYKFQCCKGSQVRRLKTYRDWHFKRPVWRLFIQKMLQLQTATGTSDTNGDKWGVLSAQDRKPLSSENKSCEHEFYSALVAAQKNSEFPRERNGSSPSYWIHQILHGWEQQPLKYPLIGLRAQWGLFSALRPSMFLIVE